jgi:hypothetical protein
MNTYVEIVSFTTLPSSITYRVLGAFGSDQNQKATNKHSDSWEGARLEGTGRTTDTVRQMRELWEDLFTEEFSDKLKNWNRPDPV